MYARRNEDEEIPAKVRRCVTVRVEILENARYAELADEVERRVGMVIALKVYERPSKMVSAGAGTGL